MVTVVGRAAVVPLPVTRLSGETWITPSVACAADTTPTNEEVGLVVSVPVDVEYRAAPSTNAEGFRSCTSPKVVTRPVAWLAMSSVAMPSMRPTPVSLAMTRFAPPPAVIRTGVQLGLDRERGGEEKGGW